MYHAKTVHWAGANNSPTRSRQALGFIYYVKNAQVDEVAKAAYHQALDVRLKKAAKIQIWQ